MQLTQCIMVNSIGRIEIKWVKIVNEKLTANHQQFNNRIKQLIGQNETRFTDPNNTKRKQQLIIISFSPFFVCLQIDYSQTKWRVTSHKTSFRDDTNNKKDEDDEYFA